MARVKLVKRKSQILRELAMSEGESRLEGGGKSASIAMTCIVDLRHRDLPILSCSAFLLSRSETEFNPNNDSNQRWHRIMEQRSRGTS